MISAGEEATGRSSDAHLRQKTQLQLPPMVAHGPCDSTPQRLQAPQRVRTHSYYAAEREYADTYRVFTWLIARRIGSANGSWGNCSYKG
jgi:hypothetical protein